MSADTVDVLRHDDEREPDPAFGLQVAFSATVGAAVTVVWVAAGGEDFWPRWVWFGLAVLLVLHLLVRWAVLTPPWPGKALRIGTTVLVVLSIIDVAIWMLTGANDAFWPLWPMIGYGVIAASATAVVHRHRLPGARSQQLIERVDELTRTRSGALDVQAQQLRQIERNLHDGAQVRLVALTMQLGRAEARLEDAGDEATLALVRRARVEASAAIGELRDLARGIAPPVLADRGLAAAAESLGKRAAVPVVVETRLGERPAPVVEAAAYFVVSEALANASKHAASSEVRVSLEQDRRRLVVVVADDGPGGADPLGSGLTGLRRRVEALDGRFAVASEPGVGTSIRAELPCVS
ncbi:sensor histidine kinase [Patulibacter minatonensis]|uniref:sensor histidine kinase n=1 Tax=Patulibacter minatonensis TaxID=298163 RepID=UPI0006852168|nr:ATP-binding protein [Patulibacter minatonensis]